MSRYGLVVLLLALCLAVCVLCLVEVRRMRVDAKRAHAQAAVHWTRTEDLRCRLAGYDEPHVVNETWPPVTHPDASRVIVGGKLPAHAEAKRRQFWGAGWR